MSYVLKVYCFNVDIWDNLLILLSSEGMLILCHNFRVSLTLDNKSDILRCVFFNIPGG